MKEAKMIRVAIDFSPVPAGRYVSDGPFSGERFRDELLWPALRTGGRVTVDLDGAEGYGSSFLEEAFGGLVRLHKISASQLHQSLVLKSEEDNTLPIEIWGYVDDASSERLHHR
ncbi:STAS-like domain-containing protein [Achromobacter dolens]|uniref:STAS-like domain-containing protein n=1 Tax=Achromobacter dolens TaxID=1287738 RepID=UPI0020C6776E|nr:STAS-like domain-containing protein [Achromobacter dolens]